MFLKKQKIKCHNINYYSLFKMKKIYFIFLFLFATVSLSFNNKNNVNLDKCDYGKEYIKGECQIPNFSILPEVYIDNDGIYKYIQIQCEEKIFIRGRKDCKYHKNIFNKFLQEVKNNHLDAKLCKVLGGGRINKNKKK